MNTKPIPHINDLNEHIQDIDLHRSKVDFNIKTITNKLLQRANLHDLSKLLDPELSYFAYYTPNLRNLTYGSEEYKKLMVDMKPCIDHHYAKNSHHPEHYTNGLDDMTLTDIIEMLCDWKAAVERHDDGDIFKSLEINKERFNMSEQLYNILYNTINRELIMK